MEDENLKERNPCYSLAMLQKENDFTDSKNGGSSFLPLSHINKEQISPKEEDLFDIQDMTDFELQKLTGDDLQKLLSNNSKIKLNYDKDISSLLMNSTMLKCRYDEFNDAHPFTDYQRPCSVASTVSTIDASKNEDLGFNHPVILNVKVPGKGVFKMSGSKTCLTSIDHPLVIEKSSICEEIFNEVNMEKIRELDDHLNIIEEIHDLYKELKVFLPQDHFHFNETAEGYAPVVCEKSFMSKLVEKSTFYSSIVNKELRLEEEVKTPNIVKEILSSNSNCSCKYFANFIHSCFSSIHSFMFLLLSGAIFYLIYYLFQ